MKYLFEANFANSGKTTIELNLDGDNDVIHSFDKIYDKMIKSFVKSTTNPKVVTWLNSNLKNWFKNEAPAYDDQGKYLEEKKFYDLFFVPLDKTIDLIREYYPKLSKDEIFNMFPDFIKKNPNDVKIFSGGRLYRYKNYKFTEMMGELIDYLNAVVSNANNRNYTLMPDMFFVNDISKLTPVNAIKNAYGYHEYLKRQAEKISKEQLLHEKKSLKLNTDYEIFDKIDNIKFIKALSPKYADFEGKAMKHCVGTYGNDIKNKTTIIMSVWGKDDLPEATFQLDPQMKFIEQLKGKHNGVIDKQYHDVIKKFIKKYNLKFKASGYGSGDYKNIGLKSQNIDDVKTQEELNFFKYVKLLLENSEDKDSKKSEKKVDYKSDFKPKKDFKIFTGVEKDKSLSNREPENKTKKSIKLNTSDENKTKEKMKNVKIDKTSFLHFLNMNLDDADEEKIDTSLGNIDITKPKPNLLPKVISTSLLAAGYQYPEFHAIKNLPGYLRSGIRAIGRKVFEPFTKTKIEDIYVIANLNNSGPNTELELNSVAKFLHDHGTRNPKYEITFFEKIPGYEAEAMLYTYLNYTFLLVKDHAGHYIYVWPSTDNRVKLDDESMTKALE
jgi:hypothetical protein